jgi:carbon storage regulator
MLVLSRKPNESIVAGGVVVTVLAVHRGRVKLGVEAPDDVAIRRAELTPPMQNRPGHHDQHEARPAAAMRDGVPASAASA